MKKKPTQAPQRSLPFVTAPLGDRGAILEGKAVCLDCALETPTSAPPYVAWLRCKACGGVAMFLAKAQRLTARQDAPN